MRECDLKMNSIKPNYVQYAEKAVFARKSRDFRNLEQAASCLYNHFVHNPRDYNRMEEPYVVGSVFATCLGFQEPDEDVQEVRAENAVFCLYGGINVADGVDKNLSVVYLFLVFSVFRKYLWQRVMKLFGAAEFGVYMPGSVLLSLPSDVRSFMLAERLAINSIFDSVLMYLFHFTSSETIKFLDLDEEKAAYLSQLNTIQSKTVENKAMYESVGKIVLEKVFEDIKGDIITYIQNYN